MQAETKFIARLVKLIEYLFPVDNLVSSNPCVALSPRIKIYFCLLLTCTEEPISTSNVFKFLPNRLPYENVYPGLSNLTTYPEYLHANTFLLIRLHQTRNLPVLGNHHNQDNTNVYIYYFSMNKYDFILF